MDDCDQKLSHDYTLVVVVFKLSLITMSIRIKSRVLHRLFEYVFYYVWLTDKSDMIGHQHLFCVIGRTERTNENNPVDDGSTSEVQKRDMSRTHHRQTGWVKLKLCKW